MSANRLVRFLARFPGRRIAVVGDFMLDHFIWGQASRLSPEAPVPVVEVTGETWHPGGAGNVAANLAALGATAVPFGVIGRDAEAGILRRELRQRAVATSDLLSDPGRPTTLKTRIIETERKHQVARADRECRAPAPAALARRLVRRLLAGSCHAVIISDYDKGAITPELLAELLPALARRRVPVFVDPRPRHAAAYRPITVLTPNRREAELITGLSIHDERGLQEAGTRLLELTEARAVLITLGPQGMALLERGSRLRRIETLAREVYDVTGAGDTVVATFALAHAAGAGLAEAAALANCAAGIVVGRVGTAVPTVADLRAALREHARLNPRHSAWKF